MNDLSPKERLLRVLSKQSVDRAPVICPGGMMNSATVDVMESLGLSFPEVHLDAEAMVKLSTAVEEKTGFENFGIPYCMTVEAEVLGSEIDFGNAVCEPKIARERYASVADVEVRDVKALVRKGRVEAVAKAGAGIATRHPDVPVIGSLTGPISTSASIVEPMTFLKELRKDRANAHRVLDYVTSFLIEYAGVLIESGFPVITVADPTATGEILGPKMFGDYAVPYLNRLADAIHARGAKVVIHICGRMEAVKRYLPGLHGDAVSTDAMVNLKALREEFDGLTVMGNVSTFALQLQEPEAIRRVTEKLVADGIDIISPACGLSTKTPVENIAAMTEVVKRE
ncbi:MAG: methylcobamide--CoM methyltransferase [Schwartzia sp.]|nr:methylcobamide--CoM methyltransferase [Schwartzia sp. (in: firmicutes)]